MLVQKRHALQEIANEVIGGLALSKLPGAANIPFMHPTHGVDADLRGLIREYLN